MIGKIFELIEDIWTIMWISKKEIIRFQKEFGNDFDHETVIKNVETMIKNKKAVNV